MPFKDIIGHNKATRKLQRLIADDRLPHALLFAGPEGIGKKLTATGLAKALFCHELKNDYCDHCASCVTINQGNHPDFILIQPEGNSIKIEQMREWQKSLEMRPYLSSWRVTIIDNAEKMTQSAANSVLKALEEPPKDTIICLITIEAKDILPTILSRCQIMRFSPLNRTDFCQFLMDHSGLTATQAGLIYNLSNGQLSKGLTINPDHLSKIRAQWKGLFTLPFIDKSPEVETDQKSMLEGLDIVAHWLRDILFMQYGLEDTLCTHRDMLDDLKKEALKLRSSLVKYRIELILRAIEAIEKNANTKLAMDCLLWEWNKESTIGDTNRVIV